ncbi:hypothetical protein [Microseira wollei]|nr:hypothetical protein [Microseira wollei]
MRQFTGVPYPGGKHLWVDDIAGNILSSLGNATIYWCSLPRQQTSLG